MLVYLLFMIPAMVLAMVAQAMVKGRFTKYSRVRASSGVSGAQAARVMLDNAGLHHVRIEKVQGFLSDHYDPRHKVLRLSPAVYDDNSVSALGVACHEAGHAIQDAKRYPFLVVRNGAVGVANFGSQSAFLLIMIGAVLMGIGSRLGVGLMILGVIAFSTVVFFQVVNLPVEFDASNRAKAMLPQLGLIQGGQESAAVSKVLGAAALTYVAATLSSIGTLAYYIFAFVLPALSGRR